MEMKVTSVSNGYIVTWDLDETIIAQDLQEVFEKMLEVFENRSPYKYHDEYGKVTIERGSKEPGW